ncbi:nicotinate-nucleotide adenylyltransferase [Spiroplasma endosymbiont of Amphibalanus improvisus]|uniref:nicotinate-nucleotide adenylyltransferase n=1 Tax=Spiroplasma endosymbiont of Amphibalanus improvisus TaxID=3066327 RepID=UPI00313EEFAF
MKIALFGGSFNPFHTDHLNIIKHAHNQSGYDEVWIVPTNQNPLKPDNMCSNAHRLAMIELAIKDLKYVKIDLVEINSDQKPNYTFDTIEYFINKYPEYNFDFIIGSDNLETLESWKGFEQMKEWVNFIVFIRESLNPKFKSIIGNLKLKCENFLAVNLSSTKVRKGEDLNLQLPVINKYINENLLYVQERMIHQGLDQKRISHSFNVAEKCVELAKNFNVDVHSAEYAGLFHDITKFWSHDKHLNLIKKYAPRLASEPMPVLHSFSGSLFLQNMWNVKDLKAIQAIGRHTVGAVDMTPLDMIVFIADKISVERDYPMVDDLRELAKKDLVECFIACVENQYNVALTKHSLNNIGQQLIITYNHWVKKEQKWN